MEKYKTKQVSIIILNNPFDSVKQTMLKEPAFETLYANQDLKIKKLYEVISLSKFLDLFFMDLMN